MKARSECVAPADDVLGGVVEIMRMFHAACAASQRPGARPTRGSGSGAVIETIGVTGGGITAGGGGGGVGRAPPRAPCASPGAPAGGVGCAGSLAWGVGGGVAGACCAATTVFFGPNDARINIAAASVPKMSAARGFSKDDSTFFIRKLRPIYRKCQNRRSFPIDARFEHLVHYLDLDRLVGVHV